MQSESIHMRFTPKVVATSIAWVNNKGRSLELKPCIRESMFDVVVDAALVTSLSDVRDKAEGSKKVVVLGELHRAIIYTTR
jgi:hypothetical protein